jgi:hypothetical protein
MEIQHLVYCGEREEGILKVHRVDVLSEWRNIKYYKGLRFQVGKAIPLDVAKIIAKDYPSVFEMQTKEIKDDEVYILQLSDVLEECLAVVGDEKALKIANEVVSKYFEGYGIAVMNAKEEVKLKAKPKRRRRK